LVLLMLDDYGLCAPIDRERLRTVVRAMLADPRIGNVHLTSQPVSPKRARGELLDLPPWSYSVNTQAAIWRRDLLLDVLQNHLSATIEQFELTGSAWFNSQRFDRDAHCQAPMPEPANQSPFVDENDKSHWVLPYHNLMHRGAFDQRHAEFLRRQGLEIG
jgi:hypothetical protein